MSFTYYFYLQEGEEDCQFLVAFNLLNLAFIMDYFFQI